MSAAVNAVLPFLGMISCLRLRVLGSDVCLEDPVVFEVDVPPEPPPAFGFNRDRGDLVERDVLREQELLPGVTVLEPSGGHVDLAVWIEVPLKGQARDGEGVS